MKIPAAYAEEYAGLQRDLFRSRFRVFLIVSNVIYFLITFFYLLRYALGDPETFKAVEIVNWPVLIAGTLLFYFIQRRTKTFAGFKACGFLYTIFLLILLSVLGAIYSASALVFPFYFALVLFIVVFTLPWSVRAVAFLALVHVLAFVFLYFILTFGMRVGIPSLTRFRPIFDGVIFIGTSAFLCGVVRRKEIERDVQNFLLLKEVEEKNRRIQKDLEFADRVHQTLIPSSIVTERAEIAVSYLPVHYVGGDYARYRFRDKDHLIFIICDVTGHGVAPALLVNRVHAEFETLVKEENRPCRLLWKLNRFIVDDFAGTGMYLSAFCGAVDFRTGKFSYSSYGHPPQYFYRVSTGNLAKLEAQTTLLGIAFEEEAGPLPHSGPEDEGVIFEETLACAKGDRLLLFTDGILEATNLQGKSYGNLRLEHFLSHHVSVDGELFNTRLIEDLKRYTSNRLTDDVFLLTLTIL